MNTAISSVKPNPPFPHALRRRILLRRRRNNQFFRAALVGLLAGALAVLFQEALSQGEQLRLHFLAGLKQYPHWGWIFLPFLAAFLGGFVSWMTTRFAPEASGSGIPHVKGVLIHIRSLDWRKLLPVKFIGGVLAISAGFSLGREGPSVQMGSAAANCLSDLLHVPRRERQHLLACGAGAGLAAAFNAPLAGFLFVIEELQHELSLTTYGTALIATLVADLMTRAFIGQSPSFHFHGYPTPPLTAVPLFAILGLAAGLLGVVFNQGLLGVQRRFHQCNSIPAWGRAALVGLVVGLAAWWLPQAVGGGHHTTETLLRGDYNQAGLLTFLLPLLALKLLLTLLCYASGVPGGIFAPLLLLGAILGLMIGQTSTLLFPSLAPTPAVFAVVGMAALFTAIVHAPVTGIVLIVEMTGNQEQLLPLLVACLVAFLVSEWLRNPPVYEALLQYDRERKGPCPPRGAEDSVLLEVMVEPESLLAGKRVRSAGIPNGCLLVTIRRAGCELVPDGETYLQAGDHLTFLVSGAASEGCAQVSALARATQ